MEHGLLEGGSATFDDYAKVFRHKAEKSGHAPEHIDLALFYAKNLHARCLPVLFDASHLSLATGYKVNFLYAVSNDASKFYRGFYIKKRSGGSRLISEPLPDLKELQRWILSNIADKLPVSKFSHAFRSGRSIKTNARFHIARPVVVKADVRDFFGSIKTGHIFELFSSCGYTQSVSALLANLCTLNGALPQGSPTSAALSNAFLHDFDEKVGGWALQNGWRYSRYADDLAFSGSGDIRELFGQLHERCNEIGLELNHQKTQVLRTGSRQIVCGIVVNQKMAVPRQYLRKLRQEIYYISTLGLDVHIARVGATRARYVEVLRGKIAHALWVSEHDGPKSEQIQKLAAQLDAALRTSAARLTK